MRWRMPEPSSVSAISPRPRALQVKRLKSRALLFGMVIPCSFVYTAATSSSPVGPDASIARATSAPNERSGIASKSVGLPVVSVDTMNSVIEMAFRTNSCAFELPLLGCKLASAASHFWRCACWEESRECRAPQYLRSKDAKEAASSSRR